MLCALIMAGGKGTRFWPLSTEEKPKQFLKLIDDRTMIQMTVDRILPIIPINRVFICTAKKYVNIIKEQLPEIPEKNIIVEPEGRNTAPCIALSALVIKRYYKNPTMLVLPSDHLISDEVRFREIILEGEKFLDENSQSIITLGMEPTRPEVGYGYIKYGQDIEGGIKKVDKFVEKPIMEKAKEYLEEGNYLWNGGMFMWNLENILSEIKKYIPNTYEILKLIDTVNEEELEKFIDEKYKYTDSISIDYAVLEKSKQIYVIASDIGWDDIGSWDAIERYKEKDSQSNIKIGNVKCINSNNNMIVASNSNIIINDLDNIYIIENEGNIIVGLKENITNIKNLRTEL